MIVEPRRTAHLWANMGMHLAVESILAGAMEAQIFVNNAHTPDGAVIWTGHRLYLAGKIDDSFSDIIQDCVRGHRRFVVYPSFEALEKAEVLLKGFNMRRRVRLYYEGDPTAQKWMVEPPDGYTIERITEKLLERGLSHTDWVREEMCSERASVEEFLEKSFGFAAVHGESFACWCTSEYNLGDRCEVGIETSPEHRRKQLATIVASAMLRHAASSGIRRVGWHCWADNDASVATAERLGLRRIAEYTSLAAY